MYQYNDLVHFLSWGIKMFTFYLVIYAVLTALGIVEVATGWLRPITGLGIHVFLVLFTVIFAIQTIILSKSYSADSETKAKYTYNCHRLSLVLATFLVLLVWLLAV